MNRNRIVLGLLLMELLAAIDTTGVTVMAPTIQKYFNSSEAFTGWILMSYLLPFSIWLVPIGILADFKKNPEQILRWSTLGFCLASALCAFSGNVYILVFARVLKGISAAGMFATEFAVILKYWEEPRRIVELAVTGLGLGVIVGPIIGGLFSHPDTWRYFFLIGSVLAMISFMIFRGINKLESVVGSQSNHEKESWWSKELFWGLSFEFVVAFVTQGFNLFLALYIQNKLNLNPVVSGLLLTIIAVGIFLANALGIGSKMFKDVKRGAWISAGVISLCMIALAMLPKIISFPAYVICLIMGMFLGVVLATAELMILEAVPASRISFINGMAIALMQGGYGLASGLIPLVYGFLGIGTLFALAVLLGVLIFSRYVFR